MPEKSLFVRLFSRERKRRIGGEKEKSEPFGRRFLREREGQKKKKTPMLKKRKGKQKTILTPPRRRGPLEQRVRPVPEPAQVAREALQQRHGQRRGERDPRDCVGVDAGLVRVGLAALVPEVAARPEGDAGGVDGDLLELEGGDAGDGAGAGDLFFFFVGG